MKLCQGQVWKQGKEYIRIVRLERLEVEYKSLPNLGNKEGTRHCKSSRATRRLARDCDIRNIFVRIAAWKRTGSKPSATV
jgi:hypothetical protein